MTRRVGDCEASNDLFPSEACIVGMLYDSREEGRSARARVQDCKVARLHEITTSLDHNICYRRLQRQHHSRSELTQIIGTG